MKTKNKGWKVNPTRSWWDENQAFVFALCIVIALIVCAGGIGYDMGRSDEQKKQVPIVEAVSSGPTSLQLNNLKVLYHSEVNNLTVCDTAAGQYEDMHNGFISLACYDTDDPDAGPYIMIEDGHNNLLTISAKGITKTKVKTFN